MTDPRFYEEAVSFCPTFLASSGVDIPSDFGNCNGDVMAVSSACSCITYTATVSSSTSTSTSTSTTAAYTTTTVSSSYPTMTPTTYPTTYPTTTYPVVPTTTPAPYVTYPGSSAVPYTTSTVYSTTVYTTTSCAAYVTDCPVGPYVTTEVVSLYTTVCPVSVTAAAAPTYPVYGNTTLVSAAGTGVKPAATTTPLTIGTNAAGRVGAGGLLAAAAALVAFVL
jgi:hypothetical protein